MTVLSNQSEIIKNLSTLSILQQNSSTINFSSVYANQSRIKADNQSSFATVMSRISQIVVNQSYVSNDSAIIANLSSIGINSQNGYTAIVNILNSVVTNQSLIMNMLMVIKNGIGV